MVLLLKKNKTPLMSLVRHKNLEVNRKVNARYVGKHVEIHGKIELLTVVIVRVINFKLLHWASV